MAGAQCVQTRGKSSDAIDLPQAVNMNPEAVDAHLVQRSRSRPVLIKRDRSEHETVIAHSRKTRASSYRQKLPTS